MQSVVLLWLMAAATSVLAAPDWWSTAIFYQIYPRSFKDSNDDGIGDIKGITSKVDYLADIGVNAVWLSPIYKSPMADFGYDISDFTDVDPIFGNLKDLEELIAELKNRNIKIIMDFVPNHSSDEHPWFNKSVNREGDFTDYYVWRDKSGDNPDGSPIEPNNWQSVFSGSAWQWNDVRKQFYLHQFVAKQPDLNFRNPLVVQAMSDNMEFWLDLGVDGFRVDAVKFLVEDDTFPDEPLIDPTNGLSYGNLDHIYTTNQNLTFTIIQGWSDLIKEKNKDGKTRIMFLEVYNTIPDTIRYYGGSDDPFALPFNFHLLEAINQGMTAEDLQTNINEWLETVPQHSAANWVVGNHDQSRIATRAGPEMVDSINMIMAMLPGIMITYNGDELGMTDTYLRFDETVDPSGTLLGPDKYRLGSRDPERTPMQWDDTPNAGFSKGSPWLPVNPNYWSLNVEAQNKASSSHLKVYKKLAELRQTKTSLSSDTKCKISTSGKEKLIIERSSSEGETLVLVVNLGSNVVEVEWVAPGFTAGYVLISSINSGIPEGEITETDVLKLRPKASFIIQILTST